MEQKNDGLLPCQDIVVWTSCGAASAYAAKMTKREYPKRKISLVYNPVIEEHPDNLRFLKDVGEWVGIEVEIAKNALFPSCSAKEVWAKRKAMSFPKGAPCTEQLKKEARRQWEDLNSFSGWHVYGFTKGEESRHQRRVDAGMKILPVLIDLGITKQDCFDAIKAAGIELPVVYSMASRFGSGFPNANCIGCVKATSPTYWNHVRETFPEVFKDRAEQSRELGVTLVRVKGKRIFLDELHPDAKGNSMKTMKTECGITCGVDD